MVTAFTPQNQSARHGGFSLKAGINAQHYFSGVGAPGGVIKFFAGGQIIVKGGLEFRNRLPLEANDSADAGNMPNAELTA